VAIIATPPGWKGDPQATGSCRVRRNARYRGQPGRRGPRQCGNKVGRWVRGWGHIGHTRDRRTGVPRLASHRGGGLKEWTSMSKPGTLKHSVEREQGQFGEASPHCSGQSTPPCAQGSKFAYLLNQV